MKKNLLIGSITGYLWQDVAPFFKSFERAGFENCDCVMFVANMSDKTIEKIKSCGVIVQKIPDKFKGISIINFRWKIYADFLQENPDKYNLVFTADVRDVFFQSDVFRFYENNKNFLGIAIEDNFLSEKTNKSWLVNAYGEEAYKTIAHERILCAGTVWGTVDNFCNFSLAMWEKLSSVCLLRKNVIDQAVGNWLIYHDKMFYNSLIKSDNQDGKVMTIGFTARENIKLDSNDNILNGKGEIAAVIHQYDRHNDIVIKVINKFCPEYKFYYGYDIVMFGHPSFIWRVVRFCYRVRKLGIFKALCVAVKTRLPSREKFS